MPGASARPSPRTIVREFTPGDDWSPFSCGVSLHAHTHHSRETMTDLPHYLARIPVLGRCVERELRSYAAREGQAIDFSKGWWHPPVSPRAVFEGEEAQIEERFGLAAIVSVTDHDDIAAGVELQRLYAHGRSPISFEWTVPFGHGFFHLGVHNLPPAAAADWFARLSAVTAGGGREEPLTAALEDLDRLAGALVVFNHPQWDLAGVGRAEHTRALRLFLDRYGRRLHALELNGYRSRQENDSVRPIAAAAGLPLVSGGDRHGGEPNALLNVTRARTFAEFADEIRAGVSHVVVMPEYRRHLALRTLSSVGDVLRRDRSRPPGRQHWTDRISWDDNGSVRALSFHWRHGGPLWVRSSVRAFQLITSPVVLPLVRAGFELCVPGTRRPSPPMTFEGRQTATALGAGDAS